MDGMIKKIKTCPKFKIATLFLLFFVSKYFRRKCFVWDTYWILRVYIDF